MLIVNVIDGQLSFSIFFCYFDVIVLVNVLSLQKIYAVLEILGKYYVNYS